MIVSQSNTNPSNPLTKLQVNLRTEKSIGKNPTSNYCPKIKIVNYTQRSSQKIEKLGFEIWGFLIRIKFSIIFSANKQINKSVFRK